MPYYFSKSEKREFAEKMREIEEYCKQHGIYKSRDSYYFFIHGMKCRVSNHTRERSNARAYDVMGNQIRPLYHDLNEKYDVEITASKLRIIEIHQALMAGKKLDKRGRVISDSVVNNK